MLVLPRGSCAALNLNIGLEMKGIKDEWNGILGTDKIGLKSFTRIKEWKLYC
jgi:hypothetical protein